MKITLIYPPTDCLNCECFTLPNLALPVLAGYLRKEGHEVSQMDLDLPFNGEIRRRNPDVDFNILNHPDKTIAYLNGRLRGPEAALLKRITGLFIAWPGFRKSDLFGITLAGFKMNSFLLNAAALIAHGLKNRYHSPVVIGYCGVPKTIYRELLEKYPVFDYAVYSGGGFHLARLVERLAGRSNGLLFTTLEKKGGTIVDHVRMAEEELTRPDYAGYPLSLYKVDSTALLSRYNPDAPVTRDLIRRAGNREQLIVMYRFSDTCRGRCAFCGNDARRKSRCLSADQVIDDLFRLKEEGATGVYFINPNFNDSYKFAEELCDKMIRHRLGLLWCDCVNFREMDRSLLAKMRRSGAVKLTFGMETGSARLLRYIRKGVRKEKISELLKASHALGIWNHIELIGGLPTETEADIGETAAFIRRHSDFVDTYSINPFFMYASSPFYREPEKFGLRRLTGKPELELDPFSAEETANNFSERFDEIGGLRFAQKDAQIRRSTRLLAETVENVSSERAIDFEHVHLLMCLYSALGHSQKGRIRRVVKSLTRRFKPYNLDCFISSVAFKKHDYHRVLRTKRPLSAAGG
ncbi:MAG: hypothetical protein A2X34_00115 [Elusimicrobia bacterium GWC2_51_8]|nr:MAG: hypothetical protein A2X33_07745 [Elusimicrobia bacterium GWA2_51_34]OGR60819.1 MAG: hypothetical protein A2X34_00115 [Elusimicrobia bacterium GWC2_51_8]HAF95811.1 hypothetical protein [Elusimicrobiota bacterium]HCE98248.1 hypothetical protein [Elusimicrobiota bacterium]